ncbi:host attachment protein [Aerolutibacter ruishenii]|uniref:Protein required for attachment to host cells n=1 Tax=Aerolutibacter ruishenii TaxID=686800 RepID=A0A562LWQ1_9GAMM|nr:host attachment protein [Lysobacter ruishenii]TWI12064.1 protein required for attachment to host cells [Lysobacter ruishenii]
MKTWILVADEAHARLFESERVDGELLEVADFVHPEAHHADRGHRDRMPRAQQSVGSARHGIEPRTSTEDKNRREFAAELSGFLSEARVAHRYDSLVLMAAPAFLGSVRSELDPQVARMVTHALDKQVTDASLDRIRDELRHLH